ncbi:formiminoglutamase [Photobacterium aphoticum]|uniref:Formiminoglutamase n=1 Tax=Photobacterium aphoticum TaxID=754436 RepID=A0A090R195_9GAMM|nr:formiminoglutamase [Photobacterium aphoticum]
MTIDMHIWQGRTDPEDGPLSQRWHQHVLPADQANDEGILLLGFACDEGSRAIKGEPARMMHRQPSVKH